MPQELNYKEEEKLNAISHGFGVIFAVFGLFFLLNGKDSSSPYVTFSVVLYSITLISMFSVSTLYHALYHTRFKRGLRILDHINIYFLIAGTYTPVALITLESGNGWMIFYMVWGIATFGTLLKLFYTGKYEFLSLLLYLCMGWLIIFDFKNLMERVSERGVLLLFLGGTFYTIGIVFYVWKRIPYNHFIWHLFVLGGAISHWLFIYLDVI